MQASLKSSIIYLEFILYYIGAHTLHPKHIHQIRAESPSKQYISSIPRAAPGRMEVTQDDLRRQCAPQHDRYLRCVSAPGSDCSLERRELERCATATVQMVRAINERCGGLFTEFQSCVQQGVPSDCNASGRAFWLCAESASPTPLTANKPS